jgi:hypothetical protein
MSTLIIDGIKPSHHLPLICEKSQMDHGMVRLYRASLTVIRSAPSDLDDLLERRVAAYSSFVISVEEYQDATGTDNKESFSLEPCLLSTGLLKSEFNGDHRSCFIIGYIPSFLNRNPQQTNVGELVHKRFWIQRSRLPQVSFNSCNR